MAARIPTALRPTFQARPDKANLATTYLLWTIAGLTVKATTGCWEWVGNRHRDGYGYFEIDGTTYRVHRLVYEFCVADPGNLMVLHHCDNRACCNPEHLYLGDAFDNIMDCVIRGRHPPSKMTPDGVREIRRRAAEAGNCNYKGLAAEFGISAHSVKDIVSRKRWKHVD